MSSVEVTSRLYLVAPARLDAGWLHEIVPELADRLPQNLAEPLRPMAALRGRTDLSYGVSRQAGQVQYDVEGRFYDGWIRDAALPYSLTDLQANFHVGADGVRVSDATAQLGAAFAFASLSASTIRSRALALALFVSRSRAVSIWAW
jgi:hypothetical protein